MSIPVTRTKLRVPRRRADLLSRPRLNAALADLLDYPFTLISAPAGYGKTSLMIDLAHQASHPACWFTIDSLDKDPKRFLAHLLHSIKLEFQDFGKPSLNLLGNLADPLNPPDQFINTLINDIYYSISENFVIFLDDFHLLEDHMQIISFISQFGLQMDENVHLVISSRKKYSIPDLPLLIGRKLVKGIDQEDLAFQPKELQEYFRQNHNLPLSDDESEYLINSTGGWITGLLFNNDIDQRLFPDQIKAAKVSAADLNSYFADQIFQSQQTPIRHLMLRTSLFDEFNEAMIEDLLGEPENISANDFLEALTNQNLFVEQIEDTCTWVRYHHLFREYLEMELDNQIPGEKQRLLSRLVSLHLDYQNWEQAFYAARQLGNPQKMAQVIDSSFSELFHAGRISLLSDWLQILPDDGYLSYPILYSLNGFALIEIGKPTDGLIKLDKAIALDQVSSNHELFLQTNVWRSTANRILGKYREGINISLKVIENLNDETNFAQIKAEAYREIGLGYGRLGQNSKALEYLNKSFTEYKNLHKPNNIAQVHMDIGLVLMNMGHFNKAETHFLDSIPHWSIHGNNIQLSILMNNLGYLSTLTGNYIAADDWLNQGEKYAQIVSSKRMQAFNKATRGDLSLSLNLFEIATSFYEEALILSEEIHDSFLSIYLSLSIATCYRCSGKHTQAERILSELKDPINRSNSNYERGLWYMELGFIHLAQNKLNLSHKEFYQAQDIFISINRLYDLTKSHLGLSLIAKKQGNIAVLKEYLEKLNGNLAQLESVHPLAPELIRHLDNVNQIFSDVQELPFLQKCMKEINRLVMHLPEVRSELFPQVLEDPRSGQITITAFGEINVHLAGKPIAATEWIHQKTVREIFFYLISHPYGLTKEQVGITFWPYSSPTQLSCQFKNAMYRMRRALGKETIQFHQETRTYSFNRDCDYKYDVEDFQEYIKLANNQVDECSKISQLQRAVQIYQHPYGPQLDGTWAEPLRRKYYLDYEKAQLEIASYFLSIENYSASRDICFDIVKIEPCQEKAYQICMEAYSGLNNMTEIHRTFNMCKENFENILGIRPSNMTIKIYKDLSSK